MSLHLEFSGAPTIGASRPAVWRRLLEPHFVAASVPGVESVEVLAPDRFRILSSLRFGPMAMQLTTEVELADLVEPERARLRASMSASGSTMTAVSTIRLDAEAGAEAGAADRTVLAWTATVDIDGMLAGVGATLVEGSARTLTTDFWTDFARRVETAL
jgi:carbon monoxide dehydrogenase subunit G